MYRFLSYLCTSNLLQAFSLPAYARELGDAVTGRRQIRATDYRLIVIGLMICI